MTDTYIITSRRRDPANTLHSSCVEVTIGVLGISGFSFDILKSFLYNNHRDIEKALSQ